MSSVQNNATSFDFASLTPRKDHKSIEHADSSFSDLATPKAPHKFSCANDKKFSNTSTQDCSHLSCLTETQESIQCLDSHLESSQQHNDTINQASSAEKAKTMIINQASKVLIRRSTKSLDDGLLEKSLPYQEVVPIFGTYGPYESSFSFLTEKKTALLHTDKFSSAFARDPLPSTGRHKFSVYIEECRKMNPVLYIGVVSGELRNENVAYRPGWTFISSFTPQSYLSGQKIIKENLLPRRGQVVTVCVDQEIGWISFSVNGTKIVEGKMSLSKSKKTDVYPFICLGEKEGRVCFI